MESASKGAGLMQLDEYVAVIAKIYEANDRNRSLWDVWCHTLHHAAAVAERARKEAPAIDVCKEVADVALWLFTAVYKLNGRFGETKNSLAETPVESLIRIQSQCSDLLWHRYPGMCPFCYARRAIGDQQAERNPEFASRCDCLAVNIESGGKQAKRAAVLEVLAFSEQNRNNKPGSIDEWQEMFATIFHANLRQLSLTDAAFHLMEELGEASDAMARMYSYRVEDFVEGEPNHRQLRLETQIADVFSWLFAVVEKIDSVRQRGLQFERCRTDAEDLRASPIHLSEIIWRRYGSDNLGSFWCPFCMNAVCRCPLIFVPATRPLEELKSLFRDSSSVSGDVADHGKGKTQ